MSPQRVLGMITLVLYLFLNFFKIIELFLDFIKKKQNQHT